MEITTQRIQQSFITIELIQDLDVGIDEVTPFISSLNRIKEVITAKGFANKFTKQEKELWIAIFNDLLDDDRVQGLQQLGGERVFID